MSATKAMGKFCQEIKLYGSALSLIGNRLGNGEASPLAGERQLDGASWVPRGLRAVSGGAVRLAALPALFGPLGKF